MWSALSQEEEVASLQTTDEIIESRGFKCETHKVETKDGYILTIHRIVIPNVDYKKVKPRPVLLQHGFANCSSHWLTSSGDGHVDLNNNNDKNNNKRGRFKGAKISNSLGFTLSNLGYDVWLSNFRGTQYSQKHKTLHVEDDEFWDFSCDEMIEYDLPAIIDHILDTTQKAKIGFVGFSAGTTAVFALLASQPRYNQKLEPVIAMAPVATTSYIRGLVKYLILSHNYFPLATRTFLGKRISNTGITRHILTGPVFGHYAMKLAFYFLEKTSGLNWDRVDKRRVGPFMAHSGDMSRKQFIHFSQFQGGLKRFDYGKKENLLAYDQEDPPEYKLENITNKSICLIYGENDYIANEEGVHFITRSLKVHDVYRIPDSNWGHLDFNVSKDLGIFVNRKVISLLEAFDV